MSKLTGVAVAFRQGWHDRINGVAPPEIFNRGPACSSSTGTHVAYERGRHAAALYEFEVTRRGTGTINRTYAEARRDMSVELRRMVDQERRFCALKPRKKNPLTGL